MTREQSPRGRLVVVSGPSGAGKTTVLRRVLQSCRVPLAASVSATTRPPRPGETDGVDYHFLAPRSSTAAAATATLSSVFKSLKKTIGTGLCEAR